MSVQRFEIKTWADAEITPSPIRLAMEEAERKKSEREKKNQAEADKPRTKEKS